mgnify:CR=1 FL=1
MTGFKRFITRCSFGCTALAVLMISASCGDSVSPTVSDASAPEPAAKRSTKIRLTSEESTATTDAGYVTAVAARTVRQVQATIGPEGGQLVVDETGGKPQDNLLVIFTVPPGALTETTTITMEVSGDLLTELIVDFDPSGTRFTPWANLYYQIGADRVDAEPSDLIVVHIYEDGTEEPVGQTLNHTGNSKTYQLWIDVPGFSRYGLRRGT